MGKEAGMFRLDGRAALVTGASRGIGRSAARVLARAGADVALTARNEELLREAAEEIRAEGRRALLLPADLREPDACRALPERVVQEWGRLDILVNNAGAGGSGPLERITEAQWDEVLETNLKSLFLLSQAAAPAMRANGWGRIVNISSISAHTGGVAGAASYAASKGGVLAFTKSAARDLAADGITVNVVAPGQIETDMGRVPPERLPELLRMIPLGRIGRPEDVAYAVLFLCSEEAGYITGATLDVNGGILKR
jgi:3-oxoacyl-[acyl-carrier protein] reductase